MFPDWVGAVLNGSGAIDWWIDELSRWSEKVAVCLCLSDWKVNRQDNVADIAQFDGLWIDMSEVSPPAAS